MIWTAFEIAINIFQGLLVLMYVRQCFTYEKKHPAADVILVCSCAGFLTYWLFMPYVPALEPLFFVFPALYAFALSSEHKLSITYWLIILALVFVMGSTVTYPIFELTPYIVKYRFPSYLTERFLCMITTNILLFFMLRTIIRVKRNCPPLGRSSYAAFILTLAFLYIIEESLYRLFLKIGDTIHLPFLLAYICLIAITMMVILLFRTVSYDSERANRYQTEIAMLSMTKQHQQELSQMYEALTARQHDYKHHLQTLEQLVAGSSESTAKAYLSSVLAEDAGASVIVTGSPEADALLTAKRRTMHQHGIEFRYSPYPLSQLPIAASDFCAIVGNLLDNAIEGVQRMSDPPAGACVHLAFSRSWDMFYIYCENPCDPAAITVSRGQFVSSKDGDRHGLHGVGLHSIEAIARRAEGRTEFRAENGVFHAKVVLPYLSTPAGRG